MSFILNKLKSLVLFIIGIIKRAFCCFKGRRRSFANEDECLTHVGVVPNRSDQQMVNWNHDWGEEVRRKPQTVEEHIQLYREKVTQPSTPQADPSDEMLTNIFQEMTPQYIKQKKVLISNNKLQNNAPDLSRLAVSNNVGGDGDLSEWVEDAQSGWDEQYVDASDILKEQRRLNRENKTPSSLGRKLKT